jgi:hypothetical protein
LAASVTRGGGAGSVIPAVARSGSDEMTASGSMISSCVWTATHSSFSNSRRVAGVSRRTSPPSSSMRAVIVSHIWPGP